MTSLLHPDLICKLNFDAIQKIKSPGVSGEAGTVSLELVTKPGHFVRCRDGQIFIEMLDIWDQQMIQDCSWFMRENKFFDGFFSFESVQQSGYFIRHTSRRLELTTISTHTDQNDASWNIADPGDALYVAEARWKQYLGRTIQVESKAVPKHYWALARGAVSGSTMLELDSHTFKLVKGLWGDETVSFESTNSPGYYLRVKDGGLWIERGNTNAYEFRRDCSFKPHEDKFFSGYTSFESAYEPDTWIRQKDRRLYLESVSTYQDNNDASFLLSDTASKEIVTRRPPPPPTTTTARTGDIFNQEPKV